MAEIRSFLHKVKKFLPEADLERISKAYEFAEGAHHGQKRYSGEPYIIHPLETATILADFRPDEDSLVAALLHDVSEDTDYTLEDIEKYFGKTVRDLVDGMEKLRRVKSYGDKSQVENLQKMFLSMAKDFRVALIKLCDRLHNMRTLQFVPHQKQLRIAKETLEIYAPIAARLGIYRLKTALEDHAFAFINPEEYKRIEEELKHSTKSREKYIQEAKNILQTLLIQEGFESHVEGRIKGIYSIYRKMKRKNKTLVADVFDVFAMRVILPQVTKQNNEYVGHLYAALGTIHNNFTPLMNRFKDYVAVPKSNGYRSLHTTVIGLGPKSYTQPTEIQLRTKSMHEQAEYGIAAHWLYDATGGASTGISMNLFEGSSSKAETQRRPISKSRTIAKKHMEWLKGLAALKQEGEGKDFFENLKLDIFQDRIFVFTPRGDVKDLPKGATPVDFAYTVHSDVGEHCHQAKVNGSIVPLNYELKNGEVVDIITRKNVHPHQNWLAFVKTNIAKSRIRAWFRDQNKEKNLKAGKDLLNEYLVKLGKSTLSPDLDVLKVVDGKRLTLEDRENLLVDLGKGAWLPSALIRRIFSLDEIIASKGLIDKRNLPVLKSEEKERKILLVQGHPNMPFRFPKCCRATEEDVVHGFITRGKGVAVHKKSCRVFKNTDPQRHIAVSWAGVRKGNAYKITLAVEVSDRVGMLRDIGDALAKIGCNIEEIDQEAQKDGILLSLGIVIHSFDELEKILQMLELIPNVKKAYVGGGNT